MSCTVEKEEETGHTPLCLLEARDDTSMGLKDTFAQVCDVVDGFIVEL
jgi:hypothetical protein